MRVVNPMNMVSRRLSRSQSEDQGAVAIIVALLLVVLLGFGAFAVDMGYAYAVKREQSVTADAAALAGAQAAAIEFREQHPSAGIDCTPSTAGEVSSAATTAAVSTYNANAPQGSAGTPTVSVTCEDGNFNVTVRGESSLPTFLGGLLGQSELHPVAEATAQVAGAPGYSGLRPYAICLDDLAKGANNATVQSEFGEDKKHTIKECNKNPAGNWGLADFDGGSNQNGDIADWTEHGYPDAVGFPSNLPGDPGADFNSQGVREALTSIVGETVLLPVATQWNESGGNNAWFTAVGAISVKVCGYAIVGKSTETDPCWNDALYQDVLTNRPWVDLVIQWRSDTSPVSYDPGTAGGSNCSLSDQYCVPTIRLWQ